MKKKLFLYFAFVLIGIGETLTFTYIHKAYYETFSLAERFMTLFYSIPQALVVSAWVAIPLFIAGLIFIWIRGQWHRKFMIEYLTWLAPVLFFICLLDWVLYGFWGFRLDVTPFTYMADDPLEAMKESPWWAGPASIAAMIVVGCLVHTVMKALYPIPRRSGSSFMGSPRERRNEGWQHLVVLVALVIIATGCFGTITMGSAYFSPKQPLNHAATNPIYSLAHSICQHRTPLNAQYRYFDNGECVTWMHTLDNVKESDEEWQASAAVTDSSLLTCQRPNILLLLLESFSAATCHYLTPSADPNLTPAINRAMAEGIAFRHLYASSFRTERGVTAVLSAYPGQPSYNVMADAKRCQHLAYLTTPLKEAGYQLSFFHGGDGQYFHLPEYLRAAGIDAQTDRRCFPESRYDGPWGLQDGTLFGLLLDDIRHAEPRILTLPDSTTVTAPWFYFVPTISSHEPFEVPSHRYNDPYLNSVAYTDSCVGGLLEALRSDSALWAHTLVIGIADHGYANYPEGVLQHQPERYRIPMFWTGGAVRAHVDVDTLCSQTDLARTLLHLLGFSQEQCAAMRFSHDIFSPHSPHFAFYSWPDGFGMITPKEVYIQDNNYDGHPLTSSSDSLHEAEKAGKAYLQTLYNDLSAR